jgi:hypothetical protein
LHQPGFLIGRCPQKPSPRRQALSALFTLNNLTINSIGPVSTALVSILAWLFSSPFVASQIILRQAGSDH